MPQAEAVIPHRDESKRQSLKTVRMSIVDHEPIIASTLTTILSVNGFDSSFFMSPVEAPEAAHSVPPDLLVSNVLMPQFTGIEIALLTKVPTMTVRSCCSQEKLTRLISSRSRER